MITEGNVPDDADLTVDSGNITIYAQNSGGPDVRSGTFELVDFAGLVFYALQQNPRRIHIVTGVVVQGVDSTQGAIANLPDPGSGNSYNAIEVKNEVIYLQVNQREFLTTIAQFTNGDNLVVSDIIRPPYLPNNDNIDVFALTDDDRLIMINRSASSSSDDSRGGITIASGRASGVNLNPGGFFEYEAAIDENYIYHYFNAFIPGATTVSIELLSKTEDRVRISVTNTEWTVFRRAHSIAVDDTYIYLLNTTDKNIARLDKNLTNNDTVIPEVFNLDSSITFGESLSVRGNNLYLLEVGDPNRLYLVNKNTIDGETAAVVRRYTPPLNVQDQDDPRLAFYNGNVYHESENIIYVYSEPSANNAVVSSVSRQFDTPFRFTNISSVNHTRHCVAIAIANDRIEYVEFQGNISGENRFSSFPLDEPSATYFFYHPFTSPRYETPDAITVEGEIVYSIGSTVYVRNLSDFSAIRDFRLPASIGSIDGAKVVNDELHIISDTTVYVIDKNTQIQTATLIRQYDLASEIDSITVADWG